MPQAKCQPQIPTNSVQPSTGNIQANWWWSSGNGWYMQCAAHRKLYQLLFGRVNFRNENCQYAHVRAKVHYIIKVSYAVHHYRPLSRHYSIKNAFALARDRRKIERDREKKMRLCWSLGTTVQLNSQLIYLKFTQRLCLVSHITSHRISSHNFSLLLHLAGCVAMSICQPEWKRWYVFDLSEW